MGWRAVTLLAALFAACPASAAAAPVLELSPGGHVHPRNNPFLSPLATATPPPTATAPPARAARAAHTAKARRLTVAAALAQLRKSGAITASEYRGYSAGLRTAEAAARRLHGTRSSELSAVLQNLSQFAAAHELTASRLPVLFETLDRNREWWTSGTLLSYGQRVQFAGSQLLWEYYPGQGIQLQVLGNFGQADGMYTAGPSHYQQLSALLSELIPLAVKRGGGLTWEYYFHFDGGNPPWTSAMSQGTALEALTREYLASGRTSYLTLAHKALPIFGVGPPTGVAEKTSVGTRYLQYSFAPGTPIINAFLEALIGLYDYARTSHDTVAQRLFAAGNAEAEAEVPQFDTGAWSLYQPGLEDSLDYHELVTGFLQQLCTRTQAPVYCQTAKRFNADLTTPPALRLQTRSAPQHKPFNVAFRLSKISRVGVVVQLGTTTEFLTSAQFPYGAHSFRIPALGRGTYTVRMSATDLAGNFSRVTGTVRVH